MKQTHKLIGLTGLLLLMLLAACSQGPPPPTPEPNDAAETDVAAESDEEAAPAPTPRPSLTILADGEIKLSNPTLPLAFETSGKLLNLDVAVGDVVEAGQVIATLEDKALQEAVTSAELRLQQSENSLVQAQSELERLLTWEPDESALIVAEANIASAEANLQGARTQAAAAGNSLTSAQINVDQARRELANAQENYDNAFSPGREWEVQYDKPVCEVIGGLEQCYAITYAERIKNDREGATLRLQGAEEQVRIAEANLALERARLSDSTTAGAESSLVSAEQELARAMKPPTEAEVAAADLNVTQAELVLEQDRFTLQQAQDALQQAQLIAPWTGTILAVDVTPGAMIGAGNPVLTLADTDQLEFHTINLSERDLAQIEIGQNATITLKSFPSELFSGQVARIGLQANGVVGDAAVFPVIITLDPAEQDIRAGMTGRVEIERE